MRAARGFVGLGRCERLPLGELSVSKPAASSLAESGPLTFGFVHRTRKERTVADSATSVQQVTTRLERLAATDPRHSLVCARQLEAIIALVVSARGSISRG